MWFGSIHGVLRLQRACWKTLFPSFALRRHLRSAVVSAAWDNNPKLAQDATQLSHWVEVKQQEANLRIFSSNPKNRLSGERGRWPKRWPTHTHKLVFPWSSTQNRWFPNPCFWGWIPSAKQHNFLRHTTFENHLNFPKRALIPASFGYTRLLRNAGHHEVVLTCFNAIQQVDIPYVLFLANINHAVPVSIKRSYLSISTSFLRPSSSSECVCVYVCVAVVFRFAFASFG